jgi:hypothetical protein
MSQRISLLMNESEHNVILGVANNLAKGLLPANDALFLSVMQGSASVGHAIRSDRKNPLALSRMDTEAAIAIAKHCFSQGIEIQEVTGPSEASESFATAWVTQTQASSRATRHLGVYELDRVIFPEPDGRTLINAVSADMDEITKYVLGFLAECFPDEEDPQIRACEIAERQIRNATLFLWKGPEDTPGSFHGSQFTGIPQRCNNLTGLHPTAFTGIRASEVVSWPPSLIDV